LKELIDQVVVDSREPPRIAKAFRKLGYNVKVEYLREGDVYLPCMDAVVERKTVSDLYKSMIDGRWFSQRERMMQHKHRILVVQVGDVWINGESELKKFRKIYGQVAAMHFGGNFDTFFIPKGEMHFALFVERMLWWLSKKMPPE